MKDFLADVLLALMVIYAVLFFCICAVFGIDLGEDF